MEKSVLEAIWKEVGKAFRDNRINSERALQSLLYHYFVTTLSKDHLILVEPHLFEYCPDIVIVNREEKTIECILELKCGPHWWHSVKSVISDFDKLYTFHDKLKDTVVEFGTFGPERIFDTKEGVWLGDKMMYKYTDSTFLVFVDIVRNDSEVAMKSRIEHAVTNLPNFVLLMGATDPDNKEVDFTVQ